MPGFSAYLSSFDYDERRAMKIKSREMLELYVQGKAQLIDIRFKEEYEAWHLGIGKNIPLNDLPARLGELDRSKLIVTMCPHSDRAGIARLYLKLNGFDARYLTDGLLGTADYLRGDRAEDFMTTIKTEEEK
ncbi:MAG: rhodanese-like domain-containing protein [Thiovulaceae bacterium]|nr:rhodanese-like domain-containing protein [Sulfurimonadaceae bacterium]